MSAGSVASTAATSPGELLERQADRLRERPFLRCGEGQWVSYAELDERSTRTACGLRQLGVSPGDRVAILAANSVEFAECIFACSKAGAVQVPINSYLRGSFLQHQLLDSGARVAITDGEGRSTLEGLGDATRIEKIVVIDQDAGDGTGDVTLSQLRETNGPLPSLEPTPADLAAIMYTSGTTGPAKGCMLPNGMFIDPAAVYATAGFIVPGDRVLTPSPMFHMGFQGGMLMTALANDASLCLLEQFSASRFMPLARAIGATVIFGVGAAAVAILRQPRQAEDAAGRLRCAIWVPLPGDQADEFEDRFAVPTIAEAYGQTEAITIALAAVDEDRQRQCAGSPNDLTEVAILDDQDRQVGAGEVGEVAVRPRRPNVMYTGYWNQPDASVAAISNLWHHTGDLGRLDDAGRLWITDRKADSLRRRGENVSSSELEEAMRRYPAVEDVAVVGVPSAMSEQDIKACIHLSPGQRLAPGELFGFFRSELPYFAIPRYVEFVEELPVNAVGRVRKDILRQMPLAADAWDFEEMGYAVSRSERR